MMSRYHIITIGSPEIYPQSGTNNGNSDFLVVFQIFIKEHYIVWYIFMVYFCSIVGGYKSNRLCKSVVEGCGMLFPASSNFIRHIPPPPTCIFLLFTDISSELC